MLDQIHENDYYTFISANNPLPEAVLPDFKLVFNPNTKKPLNLFCWISRYPEKHDYSKNERVFMDLSLLYTKNVLPFLEKRSQSKQYSVDKTDVIKSFNRKDNLHIKGSPTYI